SASQPERTSTHAPLPRWRRSAASNRELCNASSMAASLSHRRSKGSEPDGAGSLIGECVAGVGQCARLQAQAAAADAGCEVGAQALQVQDAVVEVLAPACGEFGPVLAGRHAIGGQGDQGLADAGERDAEALRHADECDPAQRLPCVSALIATGAPAGDEA